MSTVFDVVTLDQLQKLREIGLVIVHSVPTQSMTSAATRHEYPENWSPVEMWHRAVGESIRIQNVDIERERTMIVSQSVEDQLRLDLQLCLGRFQHRFGVMRMTAETKEMIYEVFRLQGSVS